MTAAAELPEPIAAEGVADAAGGERGGRGGLPGWLLLVLLGVYTAVVHWGVGPAPDRELRWFHPRGFLLDGDLLDPLLASTPVAVAAVTLPAAALALAVAATTASAVARALAASCVFACALFAFYGVQAPFVWTFFHWRASAVMATTALALGLAATAPWLVGSSLRLAWPLRLLTYVPVVFAVVAFIRDATGTDPALPFSISPWPAVPVFGLEVGAFFAAQWLLGLAAGVAGAELATRRADAGVVANAWAIGGVVVGVVGPALLVALGGALHLFPFSPALRTYLALGLACAAGIAIANARPAPDGGRRGRARRLFLGAVLVGLPLFVGQVWARWDYREARQERAGEIIAALERYYDGEQVYPDELSALVEDGMLERVPEPGIGFWGGGRFEYQNFGTSYNLEFSAPRWVQCAYSPPYEEEPGEGGEEEEPIVGSWSCPSAPPEIW